MVAHQKHVIHTTSDIQGAARASPQGNWPFIWFVCCHFGCGIKLLRIVPRVGKVDVYGVIRIEYHWMHKMLLFLLGRKLRAKVGAPQCIRKRCSACGACSFISSTVLFKTRITSGMWFPVIPKFSIGSMFWAVVGHDMRRAQENAVYFGLVNKQRIQRFLQDTCEWNVTSRSCCSVEKVGGWTDSAVNWLHFTTRLLPSHHVI